MNSILSRVSYRILRLWGGGGGGEKHGGSRMIVACESTFTHVYACVPSREVWGYAPPGKF